MKTSLSDYAYDMLKKEGSPIHYKKLTDKICKTADIKSKTPWLSVNKALTTDDRFRRFGQSKRTGLYGLAEWKQK